MSLQRDKYSENAVIQIMENTYSRLNSGLFPAID